MSNDSDVEILEDHSLYPKIPSADDDDVVIIEDVMRQADQDGLESAEERKRLAEKKKEEGNRAYTAKKYRQALELYTQAIALCPDCASYYNNRSACYLMLGQHSRALHEAREAVARDAGYVKGHLRVTKCQLALGDAAAAEAALDIATAADCATNAASTAIAAERQNVYTLRRLVCEVETAAVGGDHRRALFCVERACALAPGSRHLRARRAETLALLGRVDDALAAVSELLRHEPRSVDALYARAVALHRRDDLPRAAAQYQHVLRLAPDHARAKLGYKNAKQQRSLKEQGTESFKAGRLTDALQQYSDALLVQPDNVAVNSKLHYNHATVLAKLGRTDESRQHCDKAIEMWPDYVKAYLRRANCHMLLENYEDAVRDYEKVLSLDRSQEHAQLLHNAKLELKKSKRLDYYKILGVRRDADDDDIKKAYRKQALIHHPDRHSGASDAERRQHEQQFQQLGRAYAVLSNKQQRRRYDNGQDVDGDTDGASVDPNAMFQAFFSGAGGHGAGPEMFQFPGGGRFQFRFG